MKTICVRCSKEFEQFNHPMANFFSICFECREKEPETIFDQHKLFMINKNYLNELIYD